MTTTFALRQTLEQELASQSESNGFDALARLIWLATHIEEYVDRFQGFHALPHTTMPALLNSDFFAIIEVAAEMMSLELKRVPDSASIHALWQAFRHQLSITSEMTQKEDISHLKTLITRVRTALTSSDTAASH